MVHSVSKCTRGVQVKLWDPLRMCTLVLRCVQDKALYKSTFTFTFTSLKVEVKVKVFAIKSKYIHYPILKYNWRHFFEPFVSFIYGAQYFPFLLSPQIMYTNFYSYTNIMQCIYIIFLFLAYSVMLHASYSWHKKFNSVNKLDSTIITSTYKISNNAKSYTKGWFHGDNRHISLSWKNRHESHVHSQ